MEASVINLQGGGYKGVIVENGQVIWQCEHYHANAYKQVRIPQNAHIRDFPQCRSAKGCATVEISRRQEEKRKADSSSTSS